MPGILALSMLKPSNCTSSTPPDGCRASQPFCLCGLFKCSLATGAASQCRGHCFFKPEFARRALGAETPKTQREPENLKAEHFHGICALPLFGPLSSLDRLRQLNRHNIMTLTCHNRTHSRATPKRSHHGHTGDLWRGRKGLRSLLGLIQPARQVLEALRPCSPDLNDRKSIESIHRGTFAKPAAGLLPLRCYSAGASTAQL